MPPLDKNDPGHVSQIVLTLVVRRLDFAKRLKKIFCFEAVDAAVDLFDLALFLVRVSLLDDLPKRVVLIANDASVVRRNFETNTQDCAGRAGVVVMLDKVFQRLDLDHRHVAGKDEHERVGVFESASRRFNRITSPTLLRLNHKARESADFRKHSLLNFLCLMTNDDDYRARIECLCRSDNVRDQRRAAEFVQDLRTLRLHSRSKAGCHDQNV